MKIIGLIKKFILHPDVIYYHLYSHIRVLKCRFNRNIRIGRNPLIEKGSVLSTLGGGKIVIGNNCRLYMRSFILSWGGDIIIGDNFSLNAFSTLYGQGGVTIGNNVMIAGQCTIIPASHTFERVDIPMVEQPQMKKGIVIEDDVWIGTGVRILDGVTIRKGCVIGAGTVVTKSTEPYSVYVGVPGVKIKDRLKNN